MSIKNSCRTNVKTLLIYVHFARPYFSTLQSGKRSVDFRSPSGGYRSGATFLKDIQIFSFSSVGQNYVFKNTGKNAEY